MDSILGKAEETLEKVQKLLSPMKSRPLDLIVLPECALIGYHFPNKSALFPLSESPDGWTFQQMSSIAKEFNSYVICGYVEKSLKSDINEDCNEVDKYDLYNTAMLVDREGNLAFSYRKTFRFTVDKRYFTKGQGFSTTTIKNLDGDEFKISIAICMDLNPDEESGASFEEFELGHYLREQRIDLLVCLCAWVDSNPKINKIEEGLNTINYWVIRLLP